jgi:site-specific recombinase XerD
MTEVSADAFLAWLGAPNDGAPYSEHTIKAYAKALGQFMSYLGEIGMERPFDANEAVVRAFAKKTLSHAAKSTKQQKLSAISLFYRWAQFEGVDTDNPVQALVERQRTLKRAREPRMLTVPVLSDEEVGMLIDALAELPGAQAARQQAMVGVFLDTGLRVSELLALTVNQGFALTEGRSAYVVGKGLKQRQVQSLGEFAPYLRGYLLRHQASGDARLFPGRDQMACMTQNGVYLLVRRALARAGITGKPQRGPHLLRHTAASRMLRAGWSLARVRDALGHDSLLTTERYLHAV